MRQNQQGFTLIELIVVIVILGILAAAALPKFIDLRSDAVTAAMSGVAGAINSASNINYAASMARGALGTGVVRIDGGEDCTALATGLMNGYNTSPQYTIYGASPAQATDCTSGATFSCGISSTQTGSTATTATRR